MVSAIDSEPEDLRPLGGDVIEFATLPNASGDLEDVLLLHSVDLHRQNQFAPLASTFC